MKPEMSPPFQLMQHIVSHWISKPIYVAAELGIADLLAEGPQDIETLARMSRTHADTLYRVMRALASVGIFTETENRRFGLTPMAELLKTGAMRSIALLFHSPWGDKAWGNLLEGVKTGQTPFEKTFGMPLTKWLQQNPRAAEIFNQANAAKAAGSHRAVLDRYDFSGAQTVTDVGGGTGALMAEILHANRHLKGVVADVPSVAREARKQIKSYGLENRCEARECDFLKTIPAGSDVYLLSHILHDWPDDPCIRILKNCCQAMKPASTLLIVEMLVPPGNTPSVAKLLDLEMFVMTGGRERSQVEYETLLNASGLRLAQIITAQENVCILEVRRL